MKLAPKIEEDEASTTTLPLGSKALEQNSTSLRLKMAKDVIYLDHISPY